MLNHPDRFLPAEGRVAGLARALYDHVKDLPLICPHGHTDPRWFAQDVQFGNATELLVTPDHYVFRMLVSQGASLDALGIARKDGTSGEPDPRAIWRLFSQNFHLFAGTPTRAWLEHTFENLFGVSEPLDGATADAIFDQINECLAQPGYSARSLFERFNIERLATTEGALDPLTHHGVLKADGWGQRVVTTYRPDQVCDPDFDGFAQNVAALGDLSGADTSCWDGYLQAHRIRRAFFREHGATATDHGVPDAGTANLAPKEASALFDRVMARRADRASRARFRGQMLTEMARMSVEDGMVMQIHPGSYRNHNDQIFRTYGPDMGFDIPKRVDYVTALHPLLNAVGMEPGLTLILFTLDESAYARELAPLAGAYPCLRLGPAWWFHDSIDGMRRYREMVTETAGFYNTAGFNDDTRAFPSIPARHDTARRVDCGFLAGLVAEHRLGEGEAFTLAKALAYDLAKQTYGFE